MKSSKSSVSRLSLRSKSCLAHCVFISVVLMMSMTHQDNLRDNQKRLEGSATTSQCHVLTLPCCCVPIVNSLRVCKFIGFEDQILEKNIPSSPKLWRFSLCLQLNRKMTTRTQEWFLINSRLRMKNPLESLAVVFWFERTNVLFCCWFPTFNSRLRVLFLVLFFCLWLTDEALLFFQSPVLFQVCVSVFLVNSSTEHSVNFFQLFFRLFLSMMFTLSCLTCHHVW